MGCRSSPYPMCPVPPHHPLVMNPHTCPQDATVSHLRHRGSWEMSLGAPQPQASLPWGSATRGLGARAASARWGREQTCPSHAGGAV